jgi:acyl-CoA thioester hydrolase
MKPMSEHAGHITGEIHVLPVRVYYEDTDFSGAVYHANYIKFCERGRTDCLRLLGIFHGELHGTASFVVRRMVCDFLKPAGIDDLLHVETRFKAFSGARMELSQRVLRGADVLFTTEVTVAMVDGKGRPTRVPADMTATFLSRMKSIK